MTKRSYQINQIWIYYLNPDSPHKKNNNNINNLYLLNYKIINGFTI